MKKYVPALTFLAAIGTLTFAIGCGGSKTSPTTNATATSAPSSNESGDHSHEGHSHEGHGAGPHEGTLADWGGGKYHVEFTVDHDRQEATVYILGGDEKTPAPIALAEIQLFIIQPEMEVLLQASPQEGDPEGSASRFIGTHESLGVVQEYEGTITGVIDGTPYSAPFKEETHSHES
jgi:hypothetical protein